MSTKKGPPKMMTREQNRDATLETFRTLAEQADKPDPAGPYAGDTTTVTDSPGAAIAAPTPSAEAMVDRARYVEETASNEARAAAMEGYIKAGVAKCMIAIENHEIVGAAQFRAAIEVLMRHLHQDHPENYLP